MLLSDWFPLHCRFFEKTKNCNTCCSSCYLIGQRKVKWWSKYSCAFWNRTEVNHIDLRMKCPQLWMFWVRFSIQSTGKTSGLPVASMLRWLFIHHLSQWVAHSSWDSVLSGKSLLSYLREKTLWTQPAWKNNMYVRLMVKYKRSSNCFLPQSLLCMARLVFSEVTTCWLTSISAVVCEALALAQRARELVQCCLECKCGNDAEMLQLWPKLLCHSGNGNIWYWWNCSCDGINRAQMGNILFWIP